MEEALVFYVKSVEGRKDELTRSGWADKILKQLDPEVDNIEEIRCLALGTVQNYLAPRFQLAFLILMKERYKITKLSAWDPIFDDLDEQLLSYYGIEMCEPDPEPSDSILWYVPHGPAPLIQTLLAKFEGGVYIGNDVSRVQLERGAQNTQALYEYKISCKIIPIVCDRNSRWELAFSTTAIHRRVHRPDAESLYHLY